MADKNEKGNTDDQIPVYKKICKELNDKGYSRNWEQCREKVKKLRKQYKDIVDIHGETGRGRKKFKFFEELDAVLGSRPATKPKLVVSSDAGIEADGDEYYDDDDVDISLSPVSEPPDPGLLVSTYSIVQYMY